MESGGIYTRNRNRRLTACALRNSQLLLCPIFAYFGMQLSYASELAPHSDRRAFPRFFQSRPPFEMITETVAIYSIMDHFRWRRIGILTQDELQFTRVQQ